MILSSVHAVQALLTKHRKQTLPPRRSRGKNVESQRTGYRKKVSIPWTSKKSLSEMTEGAVHQGFVLRVSNLPIAKLDHILAKTRQEENPLLLILDGLVLTT